MGVTEFMKILLSLIAKKKRNLANFTWERPTLSQYITIKYIQSFRRSAWWRNAWGVLFGDETNVVWREFRCSYTRLQWMLLWLHYFFSLVPRRYLQTGFSRLLETLDWLTELTPCSITGHFKSVRGVVGCPNCSPLTQHWRQLHQTTGTTDPLCLSLFL